MSLLTRLSLGYREIEMGFIRLLMLKTVNYADKIENTVT